MAVEGLENWERIDIGYRDRRNGRGGDIDRSPGSTRLRWPARRSPREVSSWLPKHELNDVRVAWADAQKLNTSTLDTARVSCGPFGIDLVPILFSPLTVIARVAINQDSNHAQLLGSLNLETAEDAAVPRDGNLAFKIDSSVDQIFVVLVGAVVDIDERRRNVATG